MKDKVLRFIKNFSNPDTVKTFTEGCCFWFAYILDARFEMDPDRPRHRMMYNDVTGHFACEINGTLYDITGELPRDKYWVPWADWFVSEPSYREIVVRDCIMKTDK